MRPTLTYVATIVLANLSCLQPLAAQDDAPPIFDKRPYAEAKQAAQDGKKWFIAKATASWCAPCKHMDKTTWRDERVVKWLTEHAIAVAFDVDAEQALAAQLEIAVMPTMIAFENGDKEFDRLAGGKGPDEFLAWLEGIAKGEKSIEAVKQRAGDRSVPGANIDVEARMELARSLAQGKDLVAAADEYAWLWDHMLEHQPSMYGVRLSFMAGDMARLAERSADAMQKFTALRDKARAALDAPKVERDTVVDWVELNKIVGDTAATLAWYDEVKDVKRFRPLVARVSHELKELLIAANRWPDVGRMSSDPVAELERAHRFLEMLRANEAPGGVDDAMRAELDRMQTDRFRDSAACMYAGLLAAARDDVAATLAARARALDASPAMVTTLVGKALEANAPRQLHAEWLDAAAQSPEAGTLAISALRERLTAALAQPAPK